MVQDKEGGPYKIVPKFIFEFTKEYLSMKEANTFPIPKIIFNPSLILSPYVFLLGLLFTDKAFTAPNLTSVEQLSKLYIKPRRNKLPLPLRLDLDNIPIFWRLIKTPYGHKIKDLSAITGFYLHYGVGKAFNKNGNYADAQTFLKHYLSRRVNDNEQAIINIKRQLSKVTFSKDIKATLKSNNNRSAEYKRLIKVIITLPGTSLKDKICRRNNAINAVIDYCNIKKGRAYRLSHCQRQSRILEAAKALESAKLSLFKEKRPKIYFICLGNQKLLISKRIYRFHTPTTFTKHF
ncbi:hypothetical protein V2W45_1464289 [Cenococcum geophilum]